MFLLFAVTLNLRLIVGADTATDDDYISAFKNEIFYEPKDTSTEPTSQIKTAELRSRCDGTLLKETLLNHDDDFGEIIFSNLKSFIADDDVIDEPEKSNDFVRSVLTRMLEIDFIDEIRTANSRYWPYIAQVYSSCVDAVRLLNNPDGFSIWSPETKNLYREFRKGNATYRDRIRETILRNVVNLLR